MSDRRHRRASWAGIALTLAACVPPIVSAQQAPESVPPSDAPQMIDLTTALKLAGMNDIDLALVREAENQARAADDAATLKFFPWLSAGWRAPG